MKYISFKLSVRSFNKDDVVNDWLKKNPDIDIIHVVQSQDSESINISLFYEI
ncbi:MAG: hypothetical protein ACFFBP_15140 [Promethearchaeota archaeon]